MFAPILTLLVILAAWVGTAWLRQAATAAPDPAAARRRRRWHFGAIALASLATVANLVPQFHGHGEPFAAYAVPLLMMAAWGVLPYALLLVMVMRTDAAPRFQIALVLLVMVYGAWSLGTSAVARGGWEFLIVPAFQLLLIAVLCFGAGLLAKLAKRGDRARRT